MYQDQIIKSKQYDGFYDIMNFSDEIYYTNTNKRFEKTSTDEVKNRGCNCNTYNLRMLTTYTYMSMFKLGTNMVITCILYIISNSIDHIKLNFLTN